MIKRGVSFFVIAIILIVFMLGGWFFIVKKWSAGQFENTVVSQDREQGSTAGDTPASREEDLVRYKIPELGIEFRISKDIANKLAYSYQSNGKDGYKNALFYTEELARIPGCKASSGPLGTFTKLNGTPNDYSERDYFLSRDLKQFENFFIIYNGPQSVCAGKGYESEWDQFFRENSELEDWVKRALDTLKTTTQ